MCLKRTTLRACVYVPARLMRLTKGPEYHQFQRHPRQNSSAVEERKRRGWARAKNLPLKSTPTTYTQSPWTMPVAWKSVSITKRGHGPRQWTFEETYVWAAQWWTKERSKCLHVAHQPATNTRMSAQWILTGAVSPPVSGNVFETMKENASPPDDRQNLSLLSVKSLYSYATVRCRAAGITQFGPRTPATCELHAFPRNRENCSGHLSEFIMF